MHASSILKELRALGDASKVALKAQKFGVHTVNSLGVYQNDLNEIIKKCPKDADLAMELYTSGVYEAKLICAKIYPAKELSPDLMDQWTAAFDNWEICDTFCMKLFAKSVYAKDKIMEWSARQPEFEKRAAFATLAALTMADKKADNNFFQAFIPVIRREAGDGRHLVAKAISWSLRNIGKRNVDLKNEALKLAKELKNSENKSACWVGNDVFKELSSEKVRLSDYPRSIYRAE